MSNERPFLGISLDYLFRRGLSLVSRFLIAPPSIYSAGPALWSLGADPLAGFPVVHVAAYSAICGGVLSASKEGRALAAADAAADELISLTGLNGLVICRGGARLVLIAAFDSADASARAVRSTAWRVFDSLAGQSHSLPEVVRRRRSLSGVGAPLVPHRPGDDATSALSFDISSQAISLATPLADPEPAAVNSPAAGQRHRCRSLIVTTRRVCFTVSALFPAHLCWSSSTGPAGPGSRFGTQRMDSRVGAWSHYLLRWYSRGSAFARALACRCASAIGDISAADIGFSVIFGATVHHTLGRVAQRLR